MGAPLITGKGFDKLAASWSYAPSKQGQVCSVDLSDNQVETSWLVVVKAQGKEGEYILGSVRTRSPAAGDPKSRTILIAWHPGVTKWTVDFFGPVGATARPVIAGTDCECGGGGSFGIVPQNGTRLERRIWTPSPSQAAFADQGQLSLGPAALTKAYGFLEIAAALNLFVGFVDSLAPLVGGERFIVAPIPVPNLFPRLFSVSFDPDGVPFAQSIRWAVSGNPLVVALAGAGNGAIVQGERV